MACHFCAMPGPHPKRSFLVEVVDAPTGRWGRCVVQSECSHDIQEWMQELATQGQLSVHDQNDEKFWPTSPVVVNVDDKAAAHLPIVDPVTD